MLELLELTNLTKRRVTKKFFEALPGRFWRVLKLPPRLVSVVIVGEKKMKELNYRYRRKNKVTDVLAFNYRGGKGEPADQTLLGEIVICLPQAERQSRAAKTSLKKELARLMNHGLLHLAGYDHEKPADAKVMFALADKLTPSFRLDSK